MYLNHVLLIIGMWNANKKSVSFFRYQSINLFQSIMGRRFNGDVGRPRRAYQFLLSVTIVQTQAAEWKTTTGPWPLDTTDYKWPDVASTQTFLWHADNSAIIVNTLRPRTNGRHFPDDILSRFSLKRTCELRLKFHWNLFLGVQLAIFQHWFR